MDQRPALSIAAVAQCLSVSEQTVRKLCKNGSLPYFRVGRVWRVRPEHLEIFIAEGPAGWGGEQ